MTKVPKLQKLHRSHNSVIAGVLGGVAEFFGWSPWLLRVVFVAVIVLSAAVTLPAAILVYLVLWLLMPKANKASYD